MKKNRQPIPQQNHSPQDIRPEGNFYDKFTREELT